MNKGAGGGAVDPMTSHAIYALIGAGGALAVELLMVQLFSGRALASLRTLALGGHAPTYAHVLGGTVLVVAAVVGVVVFWQLESPKATSKTINGPDVGTEHTLLELDHEGRERTGNGVRLGRWIMSRVREVSHFLLLGLPGSGKTVTINTIVQQVLIRRERVVIHDPKGDFVQWVRPADGVGRRILYGPWDARSAVWQIGWDLDSAAAIEDAAKDWTPKPRDGGGSNSFFYIAAQSTLSGLMMACYKAKGREWMFTDLARLLSLPPDELAKAAIEGKRDTVTGLSSLESMLSIEPPKEDGGSPRLAKSSRDVISTMIAELSWVHQVAATEGTEGEPWSVREYLASPSDVLLLKSDSRYENAVHAVFGAVLRLLAKQLSSSATREVTPADPGMWMVLDEYPQLGKEAGESIRKIQEIGRSKGVRVVLASQDESQMLDMAGREGGRVQVSMQQTVILGQLAIETAQEVSKRLGMKTVARWHRNTGTGDREADNAHTHEEPIVSVQDLTGLQAGKRGAELIVILRGQPAKLTVPYPQIAKLEGVEQAVDSEVFEHYITLRAEPASPPPLSSEHTGEGEAPEPSAEEAGDSGSGDERDSSDSDNATTDADVAEGFNF